tara:strand:- start:862 stop:1101 length:240 start_codon:yes stop_codon:yes gene_type:complete
MKITKSRLTQIIKEELALSLLEEAGDQKYCCIEGQPFKTVDAGSKFMLISCGERSCRMLGRVSKKDFNTKLKSGQFKPI